MSVLTIQESWLMEFGCCWNSVLDRLRYLGKFGIGAQFQWETGNTLNTGIIEHFLTFLTRGRTQGFNFRQESHDLLKLIELIRYDFNSNRFQVSFSFNFRWIEWFSMFILFMHMHMRDHDKCRSYMFLTERKALPNINSVCIISGKSHSSP
jgi:hypothetical protein